MCPFFSFFLAFHFPARPGATAHALNRWHTPLTVGNSRVLLCGVFFHQTPERLRQHAPLSAGGGSLLPHHQTARIRDNGLGPPVDFVDSGPRVSLDDGGDGNVTVPAPSALGTQGKGWCVWVCGCVGVGVWVWVWVCYVFICTYTHTIHTHTRTLSLSHTYVCLYGYVLVYVCVVCMCV